ncbi:AbrB/MazE/SpoVT family DNA-binding domain-containing protein [Falsiroseomonas sp.]|uniref:AbrB/MazE/SpoVT family DNA-binding domain-containing protein n=1 Tax=Falsiroseomonas sp. TaxID=2870721 RepID=UPI003F710368
MAEAPTTTLSTKGQVILPKTIRDQLDWHPGTRLLVETTAEGVLLKPATELFPPTDPAAVFASLATGTPPRSLEEMEAGLLAEARRRHARG